MLQTRWNPPEVADDSIPQPAQVEALLTRLRPCLANADTGATKTYCDRSHMPGAMQPSLCSRGLIPTRRSRRLSQGHTGDHSRVSSRVFSDGLLRASPFCSRDFEDRSDLTLRPPPSASTQTADTLIDPRSPPSITSGHHPRVTSQQGGGADGQAAQVNKLTRYG